MTVIDDLTHRPIIGNYQDPRDFARDMLLYRKKTEKGFTVYQATKNLRKISPSLVSFVIQKKRSITVDRVEEFSRLLNLNSTERYYFKNWLSGLENQNDNSAYSNAITQSRHRKDVPTSILSDWINVYVKDFFQIPAIQKDQSLIEKQLLGIADPKRIRKAIDFLLREGHLRRTLDGSLVIETQLAVADPKVPSRKIRQFHKSALKIAKQAIDLFPASERLANTLIIPMDEKNYGQLMEILEDFAEKLKEFAANTSTPGNRLYQLVVNVSPVGGKLE